MPATRGRKRSNDNTGSVGPLKRLRRQSQISRQPSNREGSPSKNVHFPQNLIIGPNESDQHRRSGSPVRSALHHREDTSDRPDARLHVKKEIAQPTTAEKKRQRVHTNAKARKTNKNNRSPLAEPLDTILDFHRYNSLSFGLAITHDDVCSHLDNLKAAFKAFAESFPANKRGDVLSCLLKPENKQLIRCIGCLAMGSKHGREVGRALKEEVFDDLCFGADEKLNGILSEKVKSHVQRDGKSESSLISSSQCNT